MNTHTPDFARDYEQGRAGVLRDLECCVLGCAYGGTSWTTKAEASRIAKLLELGSGDKLLDVGAGSGWPALFLAQTTGCDVTLVDLPLTGLRVAQERAGTDGLAMQCRVVVADGSALPFAASSFDAVSHSDVLCCLPAKLATLRACHRVARAGAKMAFSVIAPAPSLSASELEIAIASGPAFVDAPGGYNLMLGQAGWKLIERFDVTEDFALTLRSSIDGMSVRADAITEVVGAEEFAERMKRRRDTLAAVQRGLLTREIFSAVAMETPLGAPAQKGGCASVSESCEASSRTWAGPGYPLRSAAFARPMPFPAR
jgi:SAM-dependent methyltransferase